MIVKIYGLIIFILEIIFFPFMYIFFKAKKESARLSYNVEMKKCCVWFHAASVGEVNAIKPLILAFSDCCPEKEIVVTTVTSTGKRAAETLSSKAEVTYLPIDMPIMMRKFYNSINPEILIIMETELWPQLLLQAKRSNVPVMIVNGRLTDKSLKSYEKTKFFWKHLFHIISRVNAQSQLDASRFDHLGFSNVQNMGNLKFAVKLADYKQEEIRRKWQINETDFVVVFGSSRPGEEKLLINEYVHLKTEIKNIKLILVPRHLRRLEEISQICSAFSPKLYSKLHENEQYDLLIVDKMGLLTELYAACDLAIVGGSFFDFGGHNPLEAVYYAKPVIMGKYYSSCKNSVELLKSKDGIIISNNENLSDEIIRLYNNESFRKKLGINAKRELEESAYVLEDNLKSIIQLLNE